MRIEAASEVLLMRVQIETTAAAEASTVAQMARLVEQAASQRSPLEGAVARFAKYYTPAVLVAALLIAFLPWAFGHNDHKVHGTTYQLAWGLGGEKCASSEDAKGANVWRIGLHGIALKPEGQQHPCAPPMLGWLGDPVLAHPLAALTPASCPDTRFLS